MLELNYTGNSMDAGPGSGKDICSGVISSNGYGSEHVTPICCLRKLICASLWQGFWMSTWMKIVQE